jgi:hypothetical protein
MCGECDSPRRSVFAVSQAVKDFFYLYGGRLAVSRTLRLLTSAESARLVDNWPRYGFSCERRYVPIAEDENGDLFCVACAEDYSGQVFHLHWAGDEEFRFASLEDFLHSHLYPHRNAVRRSATMITRPPDLNRY